MHHIEVFTGGCNICRKVVDIVMLGKCAGCKMDIIDIDSQNAKEKMQLYAITAVPSIVVDGRIKVVGLPQFPWFCGDDFYKFLEERYPLTKP